MKRKVIAWFILIVLIISFIVGCGKKEPELRLEPVASLEVPTEEPTTEEPTTEEPTTEEPTTEEPTTEEPTTEEPTTEEPTTEEPTAPATKSVWSLIMEAELNPQKSGYAELDTLIENLFAQILTDDMSKFQKFETCYLYLVDNITYSRGMDANTGAYSNSDPAKTPTEVLWASDLLNSGQGCCYNYSAAFAYIAKALGYDAHLVSGNVPKYGGGVTPHCWMYIVLEGKKYTFDPDLDMNFFSRGENPDKNTWFGRPIEEVSSFYKAETEHNI